MPSLAWCKGGGLASNWPGMLGRLLSNRLQRSGPTFACVTPLDRPSGDGKMGMRKGSGEEGLTPPNPPPPPKKKKKKKKKKEKPKKSHQHIQPNWWVLTSNYKYPKTSLIELIGSPKTWKTAGLFFTRHTLSRGIQKKCNTKWVVKTRFIILYWACRNCLTKF